MKRSKRWGILAAALALTLLCGGAAMAVGGDETDPLVTLSYLENVFLPKVTAQAEDQAAAMTVGLWRLPVSFCTIRTGRTPPCSLPTTGLKSA